MSDKVLHTDSEKWLEINATAVLFVDGRCTDSASATKTRDEIDEQYTGCIIGFKESYFYSVYIVEQTPDTVTVKVGEKTYTMHCGDSITVTMPLSYAYSNTTVSLLGQREIDQREITRERHRQEQAEREARQRAPFDPNNFDRYEDESRRKPYAMALFDAMKEAVGDEAWRKACDKAWEVHHIFRSYESLEVANYCFYPRYGRVDIDEALRWYLHAETCLPALPIMYDPSPNDKHLIYEQLVRLLYIKGQDAEARKYYDKALGIKGCQGVESWHLEYIWYVEGWDILPERVDKLLDKYNYAAANTAIFLSYPKTLEECQGMTPERKKQIEDTCQKMVNHYGWGLEREYELIAYPAYYEWLNDKGSSDYFEGYLCKRLVDGECEMEHYCMLYLSLMYLHTADAIERGGTIDEQREAYDVLVTNALHNLKHCADNGDAHACLYYANALRRFRADSADTPRYDEYFKRLRMGK